MRLAVQQEASRADVPLIEAAQQIVDVVPLLEWQVYDVGNPSPTTKKANGQLLKMTLTLSKSYSVLDV